MRLPRLALFKRNPRPAAPNNVPPAAEPLDGIAAARRQAYERFRARAGAPARPAGAARAPSTSETAPAAPVPPEAGAAVPGTAAEAPDPLAGLGDARAPAADETETAEAPAQPPAGDGGDPLDPSLLDIFRDAKQETEESSLAAEVEDVSITELLSEMHSIGERLGISPRNSVRSREPERAALVDSAPEEESAEAAVEEEALEPLASPPEPQVHQVPLQEEEAPEFVVVEKPVVVIQRPQPRAVQPVQDGGTRAAPDEAVEASQGGEGPRRFLLHVLFFGLALGLAAAGIGVRGADGGLLASAASPTPAVLAFLRPPAIPTTDIGVSHDEHAALQATAAPLPSPSAELGGPGAEDPGQTPTPTPEPRVTMPPFFMYTVESGDSYTSISRSLGMCPDHIFWANPGLDENDPLYVGQRLLLPKAKGVIYVARKDDTVRSVAERFRSTAEAIAEVPENRVKPGDALQPGQALLVPGGVPPGVFEETDLEYDMTRRPSASGYVWPFYGPITTYYGEERPGYVHYAIDIGGLFKFGAPVRAMADGRVTVAQWGDRDYGNYVVVLHDDGSVGKYAHLDSIWVEQGQRVERSEPLGPIGCTGASTGTHLHLELYMNGSPVDPLDYLR